MDEEALSDIPTDNKEPVGLKQLSITKRYDQSLVGQEVDNPFTIAGSLYAHYQYCVKQLDKLFDAEHQPQLGMNLKALCQAANKRLLELKENLAQIEMSEYHYLDGNIIQLKLVPKDFEIWHLEAMPDYRDPIIQSWIDKINKGERLVEPTPPTPEEIEEEEMGEEEVEEEEKVETTRRRRNVKPKSEEKFDLRPVPSEPPPIPPEVLARMEAIQDIQRHERARQGRLEYFDELQLWQLRNRIKRYQKIPDDIGHINATTIQKYYRGYIARRDLAEREKRLRLLIGMDMPYWRPHEDFDKMKETIALKKALREARFREYIDSIGRERDRVTRVVAPQLAEDIGDEIRYWFQNWYEVAACFDKYPTVDQGGTIMVIRGETLTPEEFLEKQEELRREKERMKNNPGMAAKQKADAEKAKKAAKEAEKKERERLKKEAAAEKKRQEAAANDGVFKFLENEGIPAISNAETQFVEKWQEKFDKVINPKREAILDPVTERWLYELQLEVRAVVDKMMRLELIMLEKALCRDLRRKYKKPREKRKKGKKGEPPFDYSKLQTTFQQFYDDGIIHSYPETHLEDFIGDYSYANSELRRRPGRPLDPPPALGDVRTLVTSHCLLPLVGEDCKVGKPRSVVIAGPPKSGKKVLVYAVCTEARAVLFDITPDVLRPLKLDSKEKKRDFLNALRDLAKALQPSVIFLNGAEKPFYTKVPKNERADEPKKWKGPFEKLIVKKIMPEDKFMVIATTRQPWIGGRPFIKFYDKIILMPRTDYGTVFMFWTKLLMAIKEVPRDMNISALTKMTVGYPLPVLEQAFQKVMSPRRILQLKYRPFHEREILEYFLRGKGIQPISLKDQEKFYEWYNKKVPLGKKRTEVTEAEEAARAMAELQAARAAQRK